MADEERMWLQRHAHESSTVSYGHFGTPVYHESTQEWHFPRKDHSSEIRNEDATEQEDDRNRLDIITDPEIVIQSANINVSVSETRRNHGQVTDSPDVTAASSLVKAIEKEKAVGLSTSHQGSRIALGSALWLSADGVDSGNLVVPVVAYVTGSGAETLCLACLGQERLHYSYKDDSTLDVRVPSLIGDPQISCPGIEPILQLTFSHRSDDGHGDTFLLVRRVSQTTIFEPLLHRGAPFHTPGQKSSSLDPNLLVTIHTSVTGGHPHVDSAFHPSDHRKIAIVDEEGNWSIWKIRGRRSTTARILYQARLRASSKILSWKHRKRPADIGLFFDGWHRVLWTSSDGQEIDRLFVCNRQTIKLFTLDGDELCSVDPRLDLGKASYIQDVRSGPKINLCLVLTTSKFLLFDIAQKEWKDPIRSKGPALLCAFQHFQNPAGLSLRSTEIKLEDKLLLGLYSTDLRTLSIRRLTFSETDGKTSMTVSDTWSITLPRQPLEGQVATVVLAPSEAVYLGGHRSNYRQEFLRVITQNEDLSVYSLWATVRIESPLQKSGTKQYLLRLPPNRSLQRKSGLRVDDAENEDDIDDFIVSDNEEENETMNVKSFSTQSSSTASGKVKVMKHVSEVHAAIREQRAKGPSKQRTSTLEVSKRLESQVKDIILPDGIPAGCLPLSELIDDGARIGDIEAESNGLQQSVSNLHENTTNWTSSLCYGDSTETLLSVYNHIFDTFVEGLPPSVPDRSRVQKERQYRSVALEQYLSRHTVRRAPEEKKDLPGKTQAASEASQMIFSDPLQHDDPESQHFQTISASQPLPQSRPESSRSSVVPSLLLNSLSRLQSYTKVTRGLEDFLTNDQDTSDHLLSVLSHLPMSHEEKPDDYDYQGRMMANAAEKAETRVPDMQAGGRAQRKAARLTGARKRAEKLSSGIQGGEQESQSDTVDKESGNNSRGVKFSGQRSQDRDAGSLPIRSSGKRYPGLAWRDKVAQTQHGYPLSDGYVPVESSSQAVRENVTLTQPERGTFANRAETRGQDKAKKRKKRIAGF